jgi:hypothetical protein
MHGSYEIHILVRNPEGCNTCRDSKTNGKESVYESIEWIQRAKWWALGA